MSNSTSFFNSVAKHNLERFHSECLTWLFNTNKDGVRAFLKFLHKEAVNMPSEFIQINEDEIIFDNENIAISEQEQIDIQLSYGIKKEGYPSIRNFKVFIENKIKASEHFIKHEKYVKLNLLNGHKDDVSQTVFYYCREEEKRSTDAIHLYVYLKPTIIYAEDLDSDTFKILQNANFNFKQLNAWDDQSINNPWITITYLDILCCFLERLSNHITEDKLLARSYLQFINNFKSRVDFSDYNQNSADLNSFGSYDYFKVLFACLKYKVSQIKNSEGENIGSAIKSQIESGSSKGNSPLFIFYKVIKTGEFEYFKYINKNLNSGTPRNIKVGIQLQGNNFKYFVSAVEYDNVTLNVELMTKPEIRKEYEKKAKDVFLRNATSFLDGVKFKNSDAGYNSCTTKTFFSRSFLIDGFVKDGKVDSFKPKTIKELIDELFPLIERFVVNS